MMGLTPADVFISYTRVDKGKAGDPAASLEHLGYFVRWDDCLRMDQDRRKRV